MMKRRSWFGCGLCGVFVLIGASCSAGGPGKDEPSAQRGDPIMYGTADTDDTACMLVRLPGGLCTGTVIAKNASTGIAYVLTAGHCVERTPPPSEMEVRQGPNPVSAPEAIYPVVSYELHPSYEGAG